MLAIQPDISAAQEHFGADEGQFPEVNSWQWRLGGRTPIWRPPTDVFETEKALVVRVEVAGMREEDFSIEITGRYLTVRGVRSEVLERRAFHQMEIRYGEFSSEVELPVPIDPDGAQAAYQDGFLRISFPKAIPHRVTVEE
jgi:HSP20 family molecular chaperone IbpA